LTAPRHYKLPTTHYELRASRPALFALTFGFVVAAAALVAACGGSSNNKAPDLSRIPTATLPATLPAPRILSSGAIQAGVSTYTVKDGDTLAGIAARFGVSLADLADANPSIDAANLSIGQVVKLPAAPEPPPDATATAPPAATATSAPATVAAPTEPPPTVPAPTEAPPTATVAPVETPPAGGQTYTVQSGDIPETIAAQFGITTEALLAANPGIDPTNLQIGQVLIIPPKPAE
jgi:LysM repeat protein